jgi:hypothetical protein
MEVLTLRRCVNRPISAIGFTEEDRLLASKTPEGPVSRFCDTPLPGPVIIFPFVLSQNLAANRGLGGTTPAPPLTAWTLLFGLAPGGCPAGLSPGRGALFTTYLAPRPSRAWAGRYVFCGTPGHLVGVTDHPALRSGFLHRDEDATTRPSPAFLRILFALPDFNPPLL